MNRGSVPRAETEPLFSAAPLPTAKLGPAERLACLRLIRSQNVGPATFRTLINQYGGASEALNALPGLSRQGGGKRPVRICSLADAEAELGAADTIGAQPIFTIEPGYPKLLAAVDVPPPLVYIKGDAGMFDRPGVAIVGSRQCSAAGGTMARRLAAGLGQAGYVIISGLARGIDGIAHEVSLPTGTVAVLAGGLDIIYPPENIGLAKRIAEAGCLITELPPGFKPRGPDFPRRNRIISGLSLGVVVVEAAARSGTLVTARNAGEQGRDVFAVPGHPLDPRAEGTNQLIKNGATLVTGPDDVIEALRPLTGLSDVPALRFVPQEIESAASEAPVDLTDSERQTVVTALGPAPVTIDAISRVTGLPARQVHIVLMELDLAGRLERQGHGLVALRPA